MARGALRGMDYLTWKPNGERSAKVDRTSSLGPYRTATIGLSVTSNVTSGVAKATYSSARLSYQSGMSGGHRVDGVGVGRRSDARRRGELMGRRSPADAVTAAVVMVVRPWRMDRTGRRWDHRPERSAVAP